MKRIIFLCLLMFSSLVEAQTLSDMLKNIRTMQADFSQTLLNKANQPVRTQTGTMALQRPGKFRWDVKQPMAQLIVANGKKLIVYDKDLEQVTIRSLDKSTGEAPALLLSDESMALEKEFTIKNMNSSTKNMVWFSLVPNDKNNLMTSIKIGFLNQALYEMQLRDHLGQITDIKFKNIKTNLALSDSLFQFSPPKNIDVIDETRKQ